ncbi:restriction endonuclease subunit S [Propionibacterium freudenreichii]|nr:restriction endonuclease subunit S [Propionibacterium freudenreichii]MDK9649045.1 restriction endonuclease subunit S [Propionibacterium freudenreichii]
MRPPPPQIRWVTLSEIGTWYGGGTPDKSIVSYWENGTIPWISPKDMRSTLIEDTQDHITTKALRGSSAKLVPANSIAIVFRSSILEHTLPMSRTSVPAALNQDMKAVQPKSDIDPRYLHYALLSSQEKLLRGARKRGGSVTSLDSKKFFKFKIPLPPLEEQNLLAVTIDSFDALVNDLSSGLPAELNARRQQYEYYRDKLLTFKELKS